MIYLTVLLFSIGFVYITFNWPEYAAVWAFVNTMAYTATLKDITFNTLEDVAANILAWFIGPILFIGDLV